MGGSYEAQTDGTTETVKRYYAIAGVTVSMRENGVVTWLLHTCPGGRCQEDQVNSTTITADADGSFNSEIRYSAYGEVRYSSGTTMTDKLYTGQKQEVEIGLSYYIARFYDPVIAHFIQPDSLIPQANAATSYDRYAYVNGNPINFNDPSGHAQACTDGDEGGGCGYGSNPDQIYKQIRCNHDRTEQGLFGINISGWNGWNGIWHQRLQID